MDHQQELAFAAGIMVGEGCFTTSTHTTRDGKPYFVFSVSMLDHVAVERVAQAIDPYLPQVWKESRPVVRYHAHKKGGVFARISLSGGRAVAATMALWPYLEDTVKGEQIRTAFARARLQSPDRIVTDEAVSSRERR